MAPSTSIFSAVLIITAVLVCYVLIRSIARKTGKNLALATLISLVFAVIAFIIEAFYDYDFIIHYIPSVLWIITGGLLAAVSISLVISKPAHWGDRALGTMLVGLIFFLGYMILKIDNKTRSRIIYSTKITGNYYYDVRTSNYYPVNVPVINYHKYELVARLQTFPFGDPPESLPDSVMLVSMKDSLLIFNVHSGGAVHRLEADLRFEYVNLPVNGIRIVWKDRRAGAIDENGNIVVPVNYAGLSDCYNGLMLATMNGKTGFINCRNEVMIPFIYRYGSNFLSDSALVTAVNGEKFWIDKKGTRLSDYDR